MEGQWDIEDSMAIGDSCFIWQRRWKRPPTITKYSPGLKDDNTCRYQREFIVPEKGSCREQRWSFQTLSPPFQLQWQPFLRGSIAPSKTTSKALTIMSVFLKMELVGKLQIWAKEGRICQATEAHLLKSVVSYEVHHKEW